MMGQIRAKYRRAPIQVCELPSSSYGGERPSTMGRPGAAEHQEYGPSKGALRAEQPALPFPVLPTLNSPSGVAPSLPTESPWPSRECPRGRATEPSVGPEGRATCAPRDELSGHCYSTRNSPLLALTSDAPPSRTSSPSSHHDGRADRSPYQAYIAATAALLLCCRRCRWMKGK